MDAESLKILSDVIYGGKSLTVLHTRYSHDKNSKKGLLVPNGSFARFYSEDKTYEWGIGMSSTDTFKIELFNSGSQKEITLIEFDTFVSVNQNF